MAVGMFSNWFVFKVEFDTLPVSIHPGPKAIGCQAYVLGWLLFTLELVDHIICCTSVVIMYSKDLNWYLEWYWTKLGRMSVLFSNFTKPEALSDSPLDVKIC